MNLQSGMLFAVPVPEEQALDEKEIRKVIEKALEEAKKKDIRGKQITPYLLRKIWEMTQGKSLHTSILYRFGNFVRVSYNAVQFNDRSKLCLDNPTELKGNIFPNCIELRWL